VRLNGRVRRLERHQRFAVPERLRLVISNCGKTLNLATSTCRRTIDERGALLEIVELDGSQDGLSMAELEAFVQGFPVQRDVKRP
jgi:CYTH domain-containing protein